MRRLQTFIATDRAWWMALVLILSMGFYFYITGYDRGLPLYESVDERNNLHEIYISRGMLENDLWKPGYPPGILAVNAGAQYVTEWTTARTAYDAACEVIRNLRLFGIPFHLAAALMIALIARKLGGNLAGLIAPTAWLFNTQVLDQTVYAFPQTYEHITYLLALWFAILALESKRPLWAILSTLCGLGAVIFKYTAFPVLGLGVGVSLWLLREDSGRWLRVMGVQFALIALCALWLFVGYDATRLITAGHEETVNVVTGGTLSNALQPSIYLLRANGLATMIGMPLIVLLGILLVGGVIYWRRGDTVKRLAVVALVGLTVLHLLYLVISLAVNYPGLRQTVPVTGYAFVLVAVALLALFRAVGEAWPRPYGSTLATVAVAVWLVPLFTGAWQHIQYRQQPVSYAAFTDWAVNTLPIDEAGDSRIMVMDDRPFTFVWTCRRFPYYPAFEQNTLDSRTLDDWRDDGFGFVQINDTELTRLQSTPQGADLLSGLTLVAQFPPENERGQWRTWRRGLEDPNLSVYHTHPIANEIGETFGSAISLQGYTITSTPQPGDTLNLWLYWSTQQRPTTDYRTFIHITPPGDRTTILAQGDAPPNGTPYRPTSTWHIPGEHRIAGQFKVTLPADLPPGSYDMVIGLYDPASGVRLTTATGTDAVIVELRVG